MTDTIRSFYDPLASHYHLIFDNWDNSIDRQAAILNPLIASLLRPGPLNILDCACGIGTQAIGFARHGHNVTASDLSPAAVARAQHEARQRNLNIAFHVSDMTSLTEISTSSYDVVAALDNALPHLSPDDLRKALHAMASKLHPGGLFLASTRDYDALIVERPTIQSPTFYGASPNRRYIHQVWDWIDHERYTVHHHITVQSAEGWTSHHFASEYRCVQRAELSSALSSSGFQNIRWLTPAESGYFQPIVIATRTS
jgi:glycine/sarcosine N-methyltransferase